MTAFAELCATLLSDIQDRLTFRAHIYIKTQILGYEPSPGDLSYPEKLEMMHVSSLLTLIIFLALVCVCVRVYVSVQNDTQK